VAQNNSATLPVYSYDTEDSHSYLRHLLSSDVVARHNGHILTFVYQALGKPMWLSYTNSTTSRSIPDASSGPPWYRKSSLGNRCRSWTSQ